MESSLVQSFSLKFWRILSSRVVKLYEASKRTSDAVEYQHIYEMKISYFTLTLFGIVESYSYEEILVAFSHFLIYS